MTIKTFVDQNNGKYLDFDGAYGAQCVDLIQFWCKANGWPTFSGNAINIFGQHPSIFDSIKNTPTGIPQPGDILVWGTGLGPYGHTAIFISGDTKTFLSFDINYPLGTPAHVQSHNYNALIGWLHPKNAPVDPMLPPDPAVQTNGYPKIYKAVKNNVMRKSPMTYNVPPNPGLEPVVIGGTYKAIGYTNEGATLQGSTDKRWYKFDIGQWSEASAFEEVIPEPDILGRLVKLESDVISLNARLNRAKEAL